MRFPKAVLTFLSLALFETESHASFLLEVTEIWPGNEPGTNLSNDWFELTNNGNSPWNAILDGNLYFDDQSLDWTSAVQLTGITTIAAGESVVFTEGDNAASLAWIDLWDDVVTIGQLGNHLGAGLSQSGDTVGIFIDSDMNGLDEMDPLIQSEAYPDATGAAGASFDTALAEFSTPSNASNAVETLIVNDFGQSATGSPFSVIPEPSTTMIVSMGLVVLLRRRK